MLSRLHTALVIRGPKRLGIVWVLVSFFLSVSYHYELTNYFECYLGYIRPWSYTTQTTKCRTNYVELTTFKAIYATYSTGHTRTQMTKCGLGPGLLVSVFSVSYHYGSTNYFECYLGYIRCWSYATALVIHYGVGHTLWRWSYTMALVIHGPTPDAPLFKCRPKRLGVVWVLVSF